MKVRFPQGKRATRVGPRAFLADLDRPGAVYNYWEPLHYIWRGKGFQTWEYSPEFAIRSYFYLLLNSFPGFVAQWFPNKVRHTMLFVFLKLGS